MLTATLTLKTTLTPTAIPTPSFLSTVTVCSCTSSCDYSASLSVRSCTPLTISCGSQGVNVNAIVSELDVSWQVDLYYSYDTSCSGSFYQGFTNTCGVCSNDILIPCEGKAQCPLVNSANMLSSWIEIIR